MKRKDFIRLLATIPFTMGHTKINELENITKHFSKSTKMPVLFIGHGHPMNALYNNNFTRKLQEIGIKIEKPNAVMVVSAHWETQGTFVSVNPYPHTIYDFGRFDEKLFDITYEPEGHPELAREVIQTTSNYSIQEDHQMGLDHGAWTILKYIFPKQDIPVFQMSIDYRKPPEYHYQLAMALRKMREKGLLIIGSGNIVHNLSKLDWRNIDAKPYDWAIEFDEMVEQKLNQRAFADLVNYHQLGSAALTSIPTNEHYLPMLYSIGLIDKKDTIDYLYKGYQYAGLSMRCFIAS